MSEQLRNNEDQNKSEEHKRWSEYIESKKDKPPSPLLKKAINFVDSREEALDLGSGAFNDTKFLLSEGFEHTTAVDIANDTAQEIYNQLSLPKDKVEYIISSFEDFDFPKDKFDLVNAQFSLPFNPSGTFNEMFEKIKGCLKEKGVFVGQFFGNKDEWNVQGKNMSFHTEQEAKQLLSNMEILKFEEEDEPEGKVCSGEPKHWHIFHIIARKKSDSKN